MLKVLKFSPIFFLFTLSCFCKMFYCEEAANNETIIVETRSDVSKICYLHCPTGYTTAQGECRCILVDAPHEFCELECESDYKAEYIYGECSCVPKDGDNSGITEASTEPFDNNNYEEDTSPSPSSSVDVYVDTNNSRWNLYDNVAKLLKSKGFQGQTCVLRTICDVSKMSRFSFPLLSSRFFQILFT